MPAAKILSELSESKELDESDPNDLLTWLVPHMTSEDKTCPNGKVADVAIRNRPAKNHLNYDKNKHVVRGMIPKQKATSARKEAEAEAEAEASITR